MAAFNQKLSISLSGTVYQITLHWCDPAQCWIADFADQSGNQILGGVALVTGADLFSPFTYLGFIGSLVVQSTNDTDVVPTYDSLGDTGQIYYLAPPS